MDLSQIPTDRQIMSTENNGYAEGVRDENLWPEDILNSEMPLSDGIPDPEDDRTGLENREVYNEEGYENVD